LGIELTVCDEALDEKKPDKKPLVALTVAARGPTIFKIKK
jgi:hypothetical protein